PPCLLTSVAGSIWIDASMASLSTAPLYWILIGSVVATFVLRSSWLMLYATDDPDGWLCRYTSTPSTTMKPAATAAIAGARAPGLRKENHGRAPCGPRV